MFTKRKWIVPGALTAILLLAIITACGAPATPPSAASPVPATAAVQPTVAQPTTAPTTAATEAPTAAQATTAPTAAQATTAPTTGSATVAAATSVTATTTVTATTAATAAPTSASSSATEAEYANAERKDTVIFDMTQTVDTPDNWNPINPAVYAIQGLRQAMWEPLLILNYSTGKLDGWLAESFDSNDAQDVWTLKLRPGITWNDGTPLTADDVIFTVDLVQKTQGASFHGSLSSEVKEMKKLDDQTVQFTLNAPNPRFVLQNFAVKVGNALSVLPKHIWEGQTDPMTFKNWDGKTSPVFTGPYKLVSASPTDFVFVRDDNWWGAKTGFQPLPAPKKLVWTASPNDDVKVNRMANNELDVMHDISLGSFQTLQAKNPKVISWFKDAPYSWPDPCPRPLDINNSVEPWNDADMRHMLNYVINRDQIVDIAYENTTTKLDGIFPGYPPLQAYMAKLPKELVEGLWTTDPAKAEEILTSKGYTKQNGYWEKDGKRLSLDIPSFQGDSESNRAVDVLVEQLQAFGIDAVNRITLTDTAYNNVQIGNYAASWGDWICGSVNEPWENMYALVGTEVAPTGTDALTEPGRYNVFRYVNKDYNALVDQIGKLPLGDPRIDPLFIQAMTIFYKDLPAIPLTNAKKLLPFNTTYWTNWPTSDNYYVVPAHWWQSTIEMLTHIKPASGQ
ncbi:MAG TPA: ABC transporter substrate-binding protein [Anaerolineae bacterium]|nr:ABC transporter substrate-binding protein [Anaerolineae bacterium]